METYKNSYTKKEDSTLWELHEIRHRLHQARKHKSIQEIKYPPPEGVVLE